MERAERTGESGVNTTREIGGMAKGGIIPSGYPNDTFPARLSSGEAVVPLDAFYSKLDILISAVEKGGNIYLETDKVGTAHNKSTFKLNK